MALLARVTQKKAMIGGGYSPENARNLAEILENPVAKKNSAIYLIKLVYLTSILHCNIKSCYMRQKTG
jgi:hypothetical protein